MERLTNPFEQARGAASGPVVPAPSPSEALELRAMTGYEEELVEASLHEPNTARVVNEIVARCLVPPGADLAEPRERVAGMSVAARDQALVEIRKRSFGAAVQTTARCACGTLNAIDFSLEDLGEAVTGGESEVRVDLEGTEVTMRLPTAADQVELLELDLSTEAEKRTWVLSKAITRHGGREGPFDIEFARGLPVRDRRTLERALEAAMPDFDLRMEVECVACAGTFSAPFDLASFFLPS